MTRKRRRTRVARALRPLGLGFGPTHRVARRLVRTRDEFAPWFEPALLAAGVRPVVESYVPPCGAHCGPLARVAGWETPTVGVPWAYVCAALA